MLISWCRGMCWGNGLSALMLFETSTEYQITSHLRKQNHKPHWERRPAPCPWRAEAKGGLQKEQTFIGGWICQTCEGFFCASFSFMQVSTSKPHWYPCGVEGFFHTSKYFYSLLKRNELQAFTNTVLCRVCKPSHWFGRSLLRKRSYSLCFTIIKIPLAIKRWHETALRWGEGSAGGKKQPRSVSESFQDHQSGSPRVSTGTLP